MRVLVLRSTDALPWLDAVAALRIEVFSEWPYCYEGNVEYESEYLATYARAASSMVAVAVDASDRVVGASTALALTEAEDVFAGPLTDAGLRRDEVLYLGESVLKASARGRGLGHAFFDAREAHAASLGLGVTAFCAVDRAPDDPRRPPDARDLSPFWSARGYVRHPGVRAELTWPERGREGEVRNTLTFWIRGATAPMTQRATHD